MSAELHVALHFLVKTLGSKTGKSHEDECADT